MDSLAGKSSIVTGSAQGIGFGIAQTLATAGSQVVIADRNPEMAEKAAASLRQEGLNAIALALDITSDASVEQCVTQAVEVFTKIDILVNNAGIHRETVGSPSRIDDFQKCFDVNLFGAWRMVQALLPNFRRIGSGRIVDIASVNGRVPWADTPAYSASKAAMINLTQSMALNLGEYDINVNAVCPGSVATPMARQFYDDLDDFQRRAIETRALKKAVTPADIGKAVLFFASPLSAVITGQSLNVDGGVTMN